MRKNILSELNNYLDRLEKVEHDNRYLVFPDTYEENIRNLIIEIGTVFMKEIPEIHESVTLRSDRLNIDLSITKGLIKKYLAKNEYNNENKTDNKMSKFLTRFKTFFENELPSKGYLKEEFIGYDNWNGGRCYLNIDYDYQYKLHGGVEYKECTTIDEIKMFIELAFKHWIKNDKRYDFTKDVNRIFSELRLPYRLQKGKIIKKEYKTTNKNEKIINYEMFEEKIQHAQEMILSPKRLDKKCALDLIIDSLQYIVSIQEGERMTDKNSNASKKVSNDVNRKVYSVVKNEINELMKVSNEYFDIRHNEYLNKAKEKREALTDPMFIEYLYNRAYALLHILKLKQ